MIAHNTIRFIGLLNELAHKFEKYGVMPLSEARQYDTGKPFMGIIYNDGYDTGDVPWHTCPIVKGLTGKTYDDDFTKEGLKFTVNWSDCEDETPKDDPSIWVDVEGEDITYHIEKGYWFYDD